MKKLAWFLVALLLVSVVAASAPTQQQATEAKVVKKFYGPIAEGAPTFFYAKYDPDTKEVTLLVTQLGIPDKSYDLITPREAEFLWQVGTAQDIIEETSKFDRRELPLGGTKESAEGGAQGGSSSSTGPSGSGGTPSQYQVTAGANDAFKTFVDGDTVTLTVKKTVKVMDKNGKPTGETKEVYQTFGKVSKKNLERQYGTTDISKLLADESFMTAAVLFRQQDIRIDQATRSHGIYYYGGSSELFLQDSAVYKNKDGSMTYIEGDFEFDADGQLNVNGDADAGFTPQYQHDDDYTIVTYTAQGQIVGVVSKDVTGVTGSSTLYAAVLIIDPVSHQPVYRVITQENDKVTGTTDYPYGSIPGAGVSGVQIYADDKGNRIYYDPNTGKYYDKDGKDLKDDSFIEPEQKAAVTKAKNTLAKDHSVRQSQNPTHLEYLGRLLSQGDFLTFIGELFKGYQQWQGLGAYGGLFLGDQIKGWRENIDDAFCKVGIGVECKAEKLCEKFSSRSTGDNVVVTSSPSSGIKAAAYVQGERSAPAIFTDEKGTREQYLYKVTYYAASPDRDNAAQLTFKYDGGSYSWYPEPLKISKGGAVSAQGTSAIIAYSDKKYSEVCIELQNGIKTGSGTAHRACAPIVSSGVTPSGETPEPAAEEPTEATPDQTTADESAPAEPPAAAGDGF